MRRDRPDAVESPPGPPIGPQYSGDNPFTARMRFHQSWYRAERRRLACGTGPMPHYERVGEHADGWS